MEVVRGEAMGGNQDHSHIVVKGKRTKRHRLQLPALTTSSSLGGDDQDHDFDQSHKGSYHGLQSPSTSVEFSGSTTEEEEDMANCLILLAQGGGRESPKLEEGSGGGGERFVGGRRFSETPTTTNGKGSFYAYECKTCNRCFPSFQALGGHRASHKKPKTMAPVDGENPNPNNCLTIQVAGKPSFFNNGTGSNNSSPNSNKSRVHECSICGAEFSSGQALGGHMRRHRAATVESQPDNHNKKEQKNILSLDLNLPAPQEDERDFPKPTGSFSFAGKQPLLFPTSALVDCHY